MPNENPRKTRRKLRKIYNMSKNVDEFLTNLDKEYKPSSRKGKPQTANKAARVERREERRAARPNRTPQLDALDRPLNPTTIDPNAPRPTMMNPTRPKRKKK